MKIAFLIPSTSKDRNWKTMEESFLYSLTLTSFLQTYDNEHEYTFYIGIDKGDIFYDNIDIQQQIQNSISTMTNISLQFIYMMNVKKGHLTIMWNQLFQLAFNEQNDYFFQCGDDIQFQTQGWVNDCITMLQSHDNIGLTGPMNNHPTMLTQTFVSRKHMDLFQYYFPAEIINWFCDDWINEIYKKLNAYYPLHHHKCDNLGGFPRYQINNDRHFLTRSRHQKMVVIQHHCMSLVHRDIQKCQLQFPNIIHL